MLSAISRHALRASSLRQMQSGSSLRCYTAGSSNNNDDNNSKTTTTADSSSTQSKPEGAEALIGILSSSPSSSTSPSDHASNSSIHGTTAKIIMDTLSKVTDRQERASSRSPNFLRSSLLGGSRMSDRQFLGDTQTCTHNLHIHASMNNTILTLTDSHGDPITTQSAGSAGFKKSARAGPEAGYQAMTKLIEKVEEKNVRIQTLHVLMKGFGPGRDSAFKAIRAKTTWDIKRITDTTPIPFNGCRPPKARRL
ncbi:hypothetical protein BGZ51_005442 [Haplosporangium sp. Z 767]|nr:hypothetical protein BGZ51_005442 [Haplosporangium sp. Z 767]KAF9182298.1 hypothetical protein BGZ50_005002 [Haplosporangium sp. Z 11]